MGGDTEVRSDPAGGPALFGGELSLGDLCPPAWMGAHTEFDDVESFLTGGSFDITTEADLQAVDDEDWDAYVAERTDFEDWSALLSRAVDDYVDRVGADPRE